MKMLSVRLDDEEAAALKALCDETGLSRSQAVKRGLSALAGSTRRGKTPGVLAEELGIVGCFSGPRDLSARVGHYVKKSLRAKSARLHRPSGRPAQPERHASRARPWILPPL